MYELGKKDDVLDVKVTDLGQLPNIWQRPTSFPFAGPDKVVVCGYDQGLGERLIVCESLQDMQVLYDKYAAGYALTIHWYRGCVGTKVVTFTLGPDSGIAGGIINRIAADAPQAVKEAIAKFAAGNTGAATVLSKRAKDFQTAEQVEKLVGWPLSEHSPKRAGEIWDRFKD